MKREPNSLGDRFAAAVISAIIVGLTAIVLWIFLIFWPMYIRSKFWSQLYETFPAWGSAIVLFAFASGFFLGTERVTELLGHLWYTAEPKRPSVTLALWVVLVGVAVAAHLIFSYAL